MHKKIKDLKITNFLTKQLSRDPETPGVPFVPSKNIPACIYQRQVYNAHFSYVQPEIAPRPKLVSFNSNFASTLGLDPTLVQDPDAEKDLVDILSGQKPLENSNAWSLCYGGHQFGSWAGQLGDGRAISLAQIEYQNDIWELQLKGAGLTPYSRFADGYAVLRSSIREYLCAEAMHHLGVPTSRSLALIKTDQNVQRETIEKGAIVCRVAASWIRLGNFEIFFARDDQKSIELLADYTIQHHFSDCEGEQKYTKWATKVVEKTAEMVAHWQSVGFCHGVMNTDNFSILGITIDYGPFQFLDQYDPMYVCNHSDDTGRYAFMEQPRMALWNLLRFCNAINHLLSKETKEGQTIQEKMYEILGPFTPMLQNTFNHLMCQKLGFEKGTKELMDKIVHPLLILLEEAEMDYSMFFRTLSIHSPKNDLQEDMLGEWKKCSYLGAAEFEVKNAQQDTLSSRLNEWYKLYQESAKGSTIDQRRKLMISKNPKFILRNHVVQEVIEKTEKGDLEIVDRYLKVLQSPFDEHTAEDEKLFGGKVPNNKRDMKCSCSS
jgi:serine/tyrosine/threonine adenylyltransferase